jgi:hypothetical protein
MKPIALFTFIILYTSIAFAQDEYIIKTKAQLFAEATINSKYDKMIHYLYPPIITAWGGRTAFINWNKRMDKALNDEGFKFKSIIVGEPGKAMVIGKREFRMIKDTIVMVGKRTIIGTSGIIAVSEDQGRKWYFINGGNDRWLYIMFPEIKGKMAISSSVISQPPMTKEVLIK